MQFTKKSESRLFRDTFVWRRRLELFSINECRLLLYAFRACSLFLSLSVFLFEFICSFNRYSSLIRWTKANTWEQDRKREQQNPQILSINIVLSLCLATFQVYQHTSFATLNFWPSLFLILLILFRVQDIKQNIFNENKMLVCR